jgi:HK97 family phage prohead protease
MARRPSTEKTAGVELRFAPDEAGTFAGYAAVWGKRDLFGDIVQPGAFAKSIAAHRAAGTRPLMLWHHRADEPIGVWDDVREDATGLRVAGHLVLGTPEADKAHRLLKAGALDGLSIGFRTVRASPAPGGGRIVHEMELIEVSLVSRPAQSAARVTAVRSAPHQPPAAGLAAHIRACAARLRSTT